MIIDRRPIYLIGSALGLLIVGFFLIASPKVTPEKRVREQLLLLAREPWVPIQVQHVEVAGEHVLVHAVRQVDGTKVVIEFVAKSPYTSPSAMHRLVEQPLEGRRCEVQMLPRSLAYEPYRQAFEGGATHVGVSFFAGFPDRPSTAVNETTGEATPPATVASRSTPHS